jgi:inner membrane protein
MSGWCVGNLFRITAGQRLACMMAASAADLDGFGILFGPEAYWDYHHKLGHNAAFGLVLCLLLTLMSRGKVLVFCLLIWLFHLHLLMDFFGSGPGWPICYFWPFSNRAWDNRHWSWEFYSWQNISTAIALLAWTVAIAIYRSRTPLERLMPSLDRQLVEWLQQRLSTFLPQDKR